MNMNMNMNMKLPFIIFFAMFFCRINSADAGTAYTFQVFANLTATSCSVATDKIYFNFYMNDTSLVAAGSASEWQSLPGQVIKLINCYAGTKGVETSISGPMDSTDLNGFKNQSTSEKAAKEVSIQLKSDSQILHDGDVIQTAVTNPDGSVDIPLAARLYTTHGNVTPGDVYAAINLTLTYK